MKTFATLALVLMAAASASAAQKELHIQLRVHTHEHNKLYITPMGKQCAYDAKIDAAEYPCRDGGVCVRKNSTYGICELPASSREGNVQMRVHGSKHNKLYITPMGKQCAYNPKIDPAEYPCRDGGVCVRKNSTYGICELPKASASKHKSHSGKHQKLYITPMGKQCAYDAKIDASEYPCRDGGVCVRKNETYGICELPGQASNLDSDSGSDDSDSDSLELPGSQDESDSSDVSDDESDDSRSSADDEESEEDDDEESVDEDDSVDNTIALKTRKPTLGGAGFEMFPHRIWCQASGKFNMAGRVNPSANASGPAPAPTGAPLTTQSPDATTSNGSNISATAGYSNTSATGYSVTVANNTISSSMNMPQSFTQALTGLPSVSAAQMTHAPPPFSTGGGGGGGGTMANAPMTMMMMMGTSMLNSSNSGSVINAIPMSVAASIPMMALSDASAQQQQQQRPASAPSSQLPPAAEPSEDLPSQQSSSELDKQWSALKALKWFHGKELTAYVQDLALQSGKRALVATSGGSYKKFVCSSETPCPWLINAVCSRPRKRPRRREDSSARGEEQGGNEEKNGSGRYWYITSGNLKHENCASSAKPTARQLKNSVLMQTAVHDDSRVSSAVLVERLKAQEQLVCSKSMVYKAKTDLLDELAKSHQQDGGSNGNSNGLHAATTQMIMSIQSLPSYLVQMSALNPHVMSFVERDDDGTFLRAVLAMDPTGVWNDQSVLGVDSCEMQHRGYNGTELVLVGRDGNLNPIVHALALVPEESPEHCTWFLEKLIAHGFPLRRFPLFTNGHWGFSASCATQQIPHVMYCTQHLIDDMKLNQVITLRSDQEALVWKAQQAESESEYFGTLSQLGQLNFTAAHYVKSLDPKRWALFPYLAMRKMYGWQTTLVSAIDHGQTMGLDPHNQLPYEFFKAMSLILMNGTFQRHERAVQWEREHRVVTPEAERMMQEEMKLLPMYNVAMSTPHLAFVWNANEPQIRQRRVDLQRRTCTCAFRMQWGIPCRHLLAALQKVANGFNQMYEYFDECYLVRNYVSSFKGRYLELPLDESIQRDTMLLPARLVNKASNSNSQGDGNDNDSQSRVQPQKKRRVRNRPLEDRKRGIYKCHKCNRAEGHNKGTCPYQLQQQQQLSQQQH